MIKKVKINKISIKEERISPTGKHWCPVGILVDDDCSSGFAGKWLSGSVWEYRDLKDVKKNRTAQDRADYFKSSLEGKEEWFEITETDRLNELTGETKHYINVKTLSKAKKQVAEEMSK